MPLNPFIVFARVIEKRTGRPYRDVVGPEINLRDYLEGVDPNDAAEAFLADEGYASFTPDYLGQVMTEAVS
jgi:hypothetical protein